MHYNKSKKTIKGGICYDKEIKHIQQCLINKEMMGDDLAEKMEAVKKLEDVASYLKDALAREIEF